MSKQTQITRKTVKDIARAKRGTPLVMLTAYDAPMAELMDPHVRHAARRRQPRHGVHGLPSTVGVTMEMMILHGQAVMRGLSRPSSSSTCPSAATKTSEDQAFLNAVSDHEGNRLPGGEDRKRRLCRQQISHPGRTRHPGHGPCRPAPAGGQCDGGFRAKGRTETEREIVIKKPAPPTAPGPSPSSSRGSPKTSPPRSRPSQLPHDRHRRLGLLRRAGPRRQDMLGLFDWAPKFVRRYADLRAETESAVKAFADDVRTRKFPGKAETYSLRKP